MRGVDEPDEAVDTITRARSGVALLAVATRNP